MGTGNVLLHAIAEKENMWVEGHSTLRHLVQLMYKNGQGVVVVLKQNRPVGILTERDVVNLLYTRVDLSEECERFARKPLVMARGKRTIGYAMSLMVENNVRRLLVVDQSDNFLGVVTQQELLNYLEEDFYRSSLKVKHVFDQLKDLVSVAREDAIREVLKKMVEHNISAIPILGNKVAVGIITEKDVLRLAKDNVSLKEPVGKYMSSPVTLVNLETTLIDVVKTMNMKNIRRVVVEDGDGLAVGIMTNRDLVRNFEGDYNEFLERKLRYTKEVLNLLPEMLFEVIDTGEDQLVVWANEKVLSRFGKEIIDKPVTQLVPSQRWHDICRTLMEQNKIEDIRFKKDKCIYEFSGFYLPVDRATEKGRMQLFLRDITQEVTLATTDPLTSIYNRRYMNEFLAKEAERSRRTNRGFALSITDVDDFKKINDTYGHLSGDIVLKEIVRGMISGTREYDTLGRYGGEEFLIILPEVDKQKAVLVCNRLRRDIEEHEIEVAEGEKIRVTVSFGVSNFQEDGVLPDDLLVKADERLYRAKREGKNRVVFE
ncbi:MAG: GGDEF domain-containing protein [Desulfobacterales bacterium]|nr:MAG: GGDEF domain-containing protein [Desulfobacterales bacterium]